MSEHTKEPWKPVCEKEFVSVVDANGSVVLPEMRIEQCGADFRRIAACVNACAGIETEKLDEVIGRGLTLDNLLTEGAKSAIQRDELLAALKAVLKVSDEAGDDSEYSAEWQDAIRLMRSVIAKAEKEQA